MTQDCTYCNRSLPWDDELDNEPRDGKKVISVITSPPDEPWSKVEKFYHPECYKEIIEAEYE